MVSIPKEGVCITSLLVLFVKNCVEGGIVFGCVFALKGVKRKASIQGRFLLLLLLVDQSRGSAGCRTDDRCRKTILKAWGGKGGSAAPVLRRVHDLCELP